MPNYSTARDWHVDRPLSNLSIALTQDSTDFIASKVGTPVPVTKESDQYTVYPQGYWNKQHDSSRAEEATANTINYKTKQDNYSVGDAALRIFISDRKRSNADSQYNLDSEGTELVNNALLIGEELDFKDKFLTTGKWGDDITGVAASPAANQFVVWSDAGADPVGDYKRYRRQFQIKSGGKRPNEIEMTQDVFDTLTEHPSILDRIRTTGVDSPRTISMMQLAGLFEVDKINIISTVVNTAVDGVENAQGEPPVNNEFLASGLFLPLHIRPMGGLMSATAIANFYIPTFTGANLGPRFRRYRGVEGKCGEYIEGELRVDRRIVAPDLGQLWSNVL